MRRRIFTVSVLLLLFCTIYGQINTQEEPISFRLNVPALTKSEKAMKSFAPLDMKKIEQEDKESDENRVPPRFGYPHKVDYNLNNSGEWVTLQNGDKIWRLAISCQGALSINLLYDKFWIPDGAKFFVYSNDRKQTIGAMTFANNKGNKDDIQGFATGLIYGNQITLEYYLPKGVKETGIISVSTVVHGYRYIPSTTRNYGGSGSCQVNVNCSEGYNWQNEKNAVAKIIINGAYLCTGSLINTTANDGRPIFLTADHCLSGADAINAPNLNNWTFYWHYESPSCANAVPTTLSTVGAIVLANNDTSVSDFALLRLTEDPRNATGVTTYYLGWDRSGSSGTGGVGIHHPAGDLKKIATYTQTPQSYTMSGGSYWYLYWIQTPNGHSVTEGGSSGSSLINSNRRVIGQLYGGSSVNCSNPSNDNAIYGKFSVSWTGNGATSNKKRLRDWLDPINTGATVLDGCSGVINYSNPIVIGNTTVTSCGELNVRSTNVSSNGNLNLRAPNKVTIDKVFSVTAGGTLNVNVP